MPRCTNCGHTFELSTTDVLNAMTQLPDVGTRRPDIDEAVTALLSGDSSLPVECPNCGGQEVAFGKRDRSRLRNILSTSELSGPTQKPEGEGDTDGRE
jgi:predicted  nucleic acid-binding Zn-ribbon protein